MKSALFTAFCLALVGVALGDVLVAPRSYAGLAYLGAFVPTPSNSINGAQGVQEVVSEYYVSLQPATWGQGQVACGRLTQGEGDLVAIETAEEDRALHNLVRSPAVHKTGEYLWTGGASRNDGTWSWVDRNSNTIEFPADAYTNWGYEKPTQGFPQYLAFISLNNIEYEWAARHDPADLHYYICEIKREGSSPGDPTEPVPCETANDLVIVLDGSGSIRDDEFLLATHFSALLAGAFAPPSRVSFIVFSDTYRVVVALNSGKTSEQIDADIRATLQPRGGTNTHLAIQEAVSQLTIGNDSRVPRKVVVLTDGVSNNQRLTAEAAAAANDAGIFTFSLGIGALNNEVELLAIGGNNPANVFTADNFHELIQLIAPVCVRVCQAGSNPLS